MKASKITAKIRDAVPVCIYAEGEEKARYKNIELPDEIKALEIQDFGFNIDAAGWISFRLYFEPGILPEELPEPKPPVTREARRAAKAAETLLASLRAAKAAEAAEAETVVDTADLAAAADEAIAAAGGTNITVTPAEPAAEEPTEAPAPAIPETPFAVKGERRKALALAIAEATGQQPEYLAAPTFAFAIGELRVDKTGTLIGELPSGLLETLAEQGFTPAE
jgi:hypothetical protein